jgi:tripartite-type tricarboxylate transporter receptor subunit TctC
MTVSRFLALFVAALSIGFALPSTAAYPDHAIRIIIGWSAGGATDNAARTLAKHLGKELGVSVIVENRDGASGMIGTEVVANSPPDGYTIQYTVADTHSINPHLFKGIRYDARNDFIPVALVGYNPTVLVVNSALGITSLKQYIERAKANPGKITFATWGIGSGGHLRLAALSNAAKIDLLHVPYKGSGPALTAVVGGQVDSMIVPVALAKAQVASGKLNVLAVDTETRYEEVPEVPTYKEQGYIVTMNTWQGVLVPKGTPQPIVDRLNKAVNAALSTPEAQADFARLGIVRIVAGDGSPAAARVYMNAEYDRWGEVIRAANITVE